MQLKQVCFVIFGLLCNTASVSAENYQCYVFCSDNQHHIAFKSAATVEAVMAEVRQSKVVDQEGRVLDILQVKECKTEKEQFLSSDAAALLIQEPG